MKWLVRILVALVALPILGLAAVVIGYHQADRSVDELKGKWAQPPSQFVEVGGMSVHLRDEGPRDAAETIVLIHGTSASLHTWDGWTAALKDKYRVIRFDLPGFGLTGPSPNNDYTLVGYTKFVVAMLDKLGVAHCALAGNSLGGQIAWATTVLNPSRVDHLVLVDASGYPFTPKSVPLGFRIAHTPGLRVLMRDVLPRQVVEDSIKNVYGDPSKVTPELVDRYFDLTTRAGNREALGIRFEQQKMGEMAERIPEIKVPTLIEWGGQDRLIPPESALHFQKDIAGSRSTVFAELGHVPHEEDPARSVAPVLELLAAP